MTARSKLIHKSILDGARKGVSGFIWMMKILVPISFFTSILVWSGLLAKGQVFIQPLMKWLNLPAEAALPLLVGTVAGIYGGIATMAVLPLSNEHMTLIAVFLLIAHALPQESMVQGKSGLNPVKAALCRLMAAAAAVLMVAPFLDLPDQVMTGGLIIEGETQAFDAMFLDWLQITAFLALKMFLIITAVMILLEITKNLGWITRIVNLCRPIMRILGLSQKSGAIWMTAAVFGLLYSAAVIIEETKEGGLDGTERERLHVSIGINHAVFEDPALFMTFGINPFWLWIPRLVMAIIAVKVFDLWQSIRKVFPIRMRNRRPS